MLLATMRSQENVDIPLEAVESRAKDIMTGLKKRGHNNVSSVFFLLRFPASWVLFKDDVEWSKDARILNHHLHYYAII